MEQNPSSSKSDRKTIERNRRSHMKVLFSKLHSLVPPQASKEVVSSADRLDEAATYIKKLRRKIEKMKEEKDMLVTGVVDKEKPNINGGKNNETGSLVGQQRPPRVEVHETGSALEVVLVTGLDCRFMFHQIIRVLHEEGVEVVNASFSVAEDDAVIHTFHSKVEESELHNPAPRITERLKKFVYGI
ncbi:hypothetical protein NMG60_11014837 [Bertholletia excelsa]